MKKLTDKQALFVQEYLKDLNATQAAIRAGYSESTANKIASQNLAKLDIQEAIKKEQDKRAERNKIDADYVLKRLVEIDEMDVADILDNTGNFKSITQWPKVWRTTLSGLDIQEIAMGDISTVMRKIKWPDKVKNLELLGRHINVQAFKEQLKVEGELDLVSPLVAARKRLEQRK